MTEMLDACCPGTRSPGLHSSCLPCSLCLHGSAGSSHSSWFGSCSGHLARLHLLHPPHPHHPPHLPPHHHNRLLLLHQLLPALRQLNLLHLLLVSMIVLSPLALDHLVLGSEVTWVSAGASPERLQETPPHVVEGHKPCGDSVERASSPVQGFQLPLRESTCETCTRATDHLWFSGSSCACSRRASSSLPGAAKGCCIFPERHHLAH
mmetsp:Transcript_376/g.749  ORF Transcript_376/g.749 Transcript_376/m.749 type:complete len:207 (+) Transcript_376:1528-2148(+)